MKVNIKYTKNKQNIKFSGLYLESAAIFWVIISHFLKRFSIIFQ